MKKIILIPFLFIATFCFAQYPNGIQTLGNDSNMVVAKGGFTAKGGVQVANYVDTTAANLSRIRQYSGATIFTTSDNVFWVRNGTATAWLKIGSNVSPAGTDCSLIGGIVTPATGLTFDITMASYCISDTPHIYSGGQITLDAADALLPRIDVIGLDNTGNAFKITGIPATDPAVPQVDPSTQLYLTHVYISAGATTPTGVSSYTIWDENTEWTGSATGVTVDFNNTSTVYHLTKSTDVGIHTTNDLVSYAGSGVHLQGYNVVKFFINLKEAMPANRNISIGLFTNSQPMTNYLTLSAAHGFNKSLVGQWQEVTVPLTDFNYLSESPLTGLKFRIQGAGAGFYLDWITLHGGLPINTGSNAITNVYRIAGTTNVMKVVNGVASLAFVDSVGGGSADSIVVVQQPLQSLPSGVSGVPDTLKFNPDSSGLVKDVYKKAGTDSVFKKINNVEVFAYKDSSGGGGGSVPAMITDPVLKAYLEYEGNFTGIYANTSVLSPNGGVVGQMHFASVYNDEVNTTYNFRYLCVAENTWVRDLINTVPYYGVPTTIPDLGLWLDASNNSMLQTLSGNVLAWKDKSGRGMDAKYISGTYATVQTAYQNGLNALLFNGAPGMKITTGLDLMQSISGMSIYIAIKYNTPATAGYAIGMHTTGAVVMTRMGVGNSANKGHVGGRRLAADAIRQFNTTGTFTTDFKIHSAIIDYSTNNCKQYQNGVLDSEDTSFGTPGSTANNVLGEVIIGSSTSGPVNAYIGEIIVYRRTLTSLEDAKVISYLKQKWGL